ncbi:hypothetical protein Trydic_g10500 [Trypoxylus dichotomus]
MVNLGRLFVSMVIVVINLNSVKMVDDLNVSKRADIDLKTCIDNFAVHKDKIIRTQDSRAMGAKYLNEIDLDTREECLRLCCETENCDVFVYEEKSVGSCYLFQCGPPEDFKCKFTHHVNYSSGVLTVNRHLPDLESQIKLTKHEEDLTKLRKPEIDSSGPQIASQPKTTPTTTTTTTKRKEPLDPTPNTKPTVESTCSRFQFECRSNSECIAIYNACDGIPQCSDGSDEAPELGCPGSLTTLPTPISRVNNNVQIAENAVPRTPVSSPSQDIYRVTNQRQSLQVQPPPRQEDFIRPAAADPRNLVAPPNQYEAQQQIPQYNQYAQQVQQNWIARQSNQLLSQIPQYADKNSHIFNHKENGLQVPDGPETSQPQPYNDMGNHEYPKVPNYYGDIGYRQPIQQMPESWSNNADYRNVPYMPEMNSNLRETWRPNLPQPIPPQPNMAPQEPQENPNNPSQHDLTPSWISDDKNPTHVQNKLAHDLKQHSKEHQEAKASEAAEDKRVKIQNHSHEHEVEHPKFASGIAERLELRDGIAEAPGGAILSLTLGLIITCLMAILIGCRLRVVRRRMRRGGKSYAHDADYLVNGMYL